MNDEGDHRGINLIDDDVMENRASRWLPVMVVTGVVGGFVALAWYAYHSGMESMREEDLLVVEADKTPMKEKPSDPGGMQFPNQDKTIFETFAGNQQPAKVERVLPPPEEPMQPEMEVSGTSTWVNEKLQKADNAAPEQVIAPAQKTPAKAETTETPLPAVTIKPQIEESVTYVADKPAKPVAEEKPKAEAPKEVKPAPASGGTQIQLGAYRSDKEARDAWSKIQKKQPALADRDSLVVKADLGDKGIYYRLRVGGFSSATEAKVVCSKLTGGQACVVVTGK